MATDAADITLQDGLYDDISSIETIIGTQQILKGFEELDQRLRKINTQSLNDGSIALLAPVEKGISTSNSVQPLFNTMQIAQGSTDDIIAETIKPSFNISQPGLAFSRGIGEFELAVLEAAISQLNGNEAGFTTAMLCRTLTGKTKKYGERISAELMDDVDNAMLRLMYSPFIATINRDEKLQFQSGAILPVMRFQQKICGNLVTVYRFTGVPLLLHILNEKNAITMYPVEMSRIPTISSTKRSIATINAIQRQICPFIFANDGKLLKTDDENGQEQEPAVIPYEMLYKAAWAADSRGKSDEASYPHSLIEKVRDNTKTILDEWLNQGLISGWDVFKEGRTIKGVIVKFHKIAKQ